VSLSQVGEQVNEVLWHLECKKTMLCYKVRHNMHGYVKDCKDNQGSKIVTCELKNAGSMTDLLGRNTVV